MARLIGDPPRVSAIIIFLDEERFMGEAIASVMAQTFEDWELILVDDGSRDRSGQMARDAAERDARVRCISHRDGLNLGMSASRNAGVAAARGDLIAFLDADDVWVPEKLAEQVAIFDASPEVEMVYGRTLIWHEWDPQSAHSDFLYDLGVAPDRLYPPGSLFPVLISNRFQTPTSINAMMRRDLLHRTGGFEDAFRGMFEDQVFFSKAHLVSTCHVDSRIWAWYRQHEGSCSAGTSALEDIRARRRFLEWVDRYVTEQGRRTGPVRRALARARLDLARSALRWRFRDLLGRT